MENLKFREVNTFSPGHSELIKALGIVYLLLRGCETLFNFLKHSLDPGGFIFQA